MPRSVTLRELVMQYKDQFPLLVSISRLENPVGSNISIKKGQLLYVHFHKEFYTVDVKTSNGVKYKVPLRSSLSCSVLYQPHNNVTRTESDYVFGNVSDIIRAKPLPKMLYVEVGYLSPNGEETSSVEEGEILIVNGVRGSNKVKVLECMDINTGEVKHLEETCNGTFSTKPAHLKVDLSEVIQYLSLPLPVLFYVSDSSQLSSELVGTITGKSLSQSLITSFYDKNIYDNEFQEVIEIVTDALVKVKVISLPASEKSELEKSTFDILKTFSPAVVTEVIADVSTPVDTKLQTELFRYMKEDIYWCEEVVKPELSSLKGCTLSFESDPVDNTQTSQESKVSEATLPFLTSDELEDEIYEEVGPLIEFDYDTSRVIVVHDKDSPENTEYSYTKFECLDSTFYQNMQQLHTTEKKFKSEIAHNIKVPQLLPEQIEQNVILQPQLESSDQTLHYSASTNLAGLPAQQHSASIASTPSLQPGLYKLTQPPLNCPFIVESQTLDRSQNKIKHDTVQSIGRSDSLSIDSSLQKETVDEEVKKCNQERLQQYTVKEVLDLLDKLHLSKYKDTFEEEQITGSLLLDIDDEILKEDLGVHRKLDRLKIMRVIQGRVSL